MVCEAEVPGYARLRLTVSIGGVLADNETIESAVARADGLMYQAKNRKNMIVTEKWYRQCGSQRTAADPDRR